MNVQDLNSVFPEEINLDNRYDDKVILKHINGNKYELVLSSLYCSVIGNTEKPHAVDPSGGPFVSIGFKATENLRVSNIYSDEKLKGYAIELEHIN